MTEAAEASETSCSPERPPKSTPTRSRFFLSGVTNLSCLAGPREQLWDTEFSYKGKRRKREKGVAAQLLHSQPLWVLDAACQVP